MGQKIHPYKFRLGITKNWVSRWFPSKKDTPFRLEEDILIRKIIKDRISSAGIVKVEIERGTGNTYKIFIKAARPGLIIGRGGKGIEELSQALDSGLKKLFRKRGFQDSKHSISVNVEELKRSEISAQYVGQSIAWDIEKRMRFRRVVKRQVENVMQNRDVKGVKIKISGRLDGSEISRSERFAKGQMPLQNLRADIDYGEATANCTYGAVGLKVWIYRGEIFDTDAKKKKDRN
jgi:small subunit ribosomal protein S3